MFNRSRKKIILSIMGSLILLFSVTLSVILAASFREVRHRNSKMLEHYVQTYSLEQQTGMNAPEQQTGMSALEQQTEMNALEQQTGMNAPEEQTGMDASDQQTAGQNIPAHKPVHESDRQEMQGPPPDPGKPPIDERRDYQLSTFYSVALSEDGEVLAVDNGIKAVYEENDLAELAKGILEGNTSSGRIDNLFYMVSCRDGYTLVAFMDNTVSEGGLHTLLRTVLIVGGASIVLLFFISLFLSKRIIQPLEENDRQQKQFISDAGHELKTPVAVISTNAEMLARELGENEWLSNIQYENERMGDLVKQLLDLSRAENTEAPMETVDLSRLVTGEVLAFESLAFDQGKTIQSNIDDGISITGDQARLTQLTSILLDNSVRHSTGSEIEVSLKREGHSVVLSVVNEGSEIPPDKLDRLFDRFYRVDEARSDEGNHYGLGLSIAKAVAEKHGGSISAACQDGKIRFSVSIPEK